MLEVSMPGREEAIIKSPQKVSWNEETQFCTEEKKIMLSGLRGLRETQGSGKDFNLPITQRTKLSHASNVTGFLSSFKYRIHHTH